MWLPVVVFFGGPFSVICLGGLGWRPSPNHGFVNWPTEFFHKSVMLSGSLVTN